jgi:aspartyl/glutamyl-tRNA(Asn/Gln) amidotransferase C subunit
MDTKIMIENIEILKIADLAGLKLNEKDLKKYGNDLNKIIELYNVIDEIDDVEYKASEIKFLKFRSDIPKNSLKKEEIFSNAHIKENDYFIVLQIKDKK